MLFVSVFSVLSAAAEPAVFIPDTATAVVPIIQLGPDPAVVFGLAQGAESITAHIDARASLSVVAGRHYASASPRALQVSVVVHDVPDAAVKVERRGDPVAVKILAAGANLVAPDVDIAAGFTIGAARTS